MEIVPQKIHLLLGNFTKVLQSNAKKSTWCHLIVEPRCCVSRVRCFILHQKTLEKSRTWNCWREPRATQIKGSGPGEWADGLVPNSFLSSLSTPAGSRALSAGCEARLLNPTSPLQVQQLEFASPLQVLGVLLKGSCIGNLIFLKHNSWKYEELEKRKEKKHRDLIWHLRSRSSHFETP